jgi:hypothetical protein
MIETAIRLMDGPPVDYGRLGKRGLTNMATEVMNRKSLGDKTRPIWDS